MTAYQQPSFMIDNLLTRKAIDQNGDYPTVPMATGAIGRRRGSSDDGEVVNGSGRVLADVVSRHTCTHTHAHTHTHTHSINIPFSYTVCI